MKQQYVLLALLMVPVLLSQIPVHATSSIPTQTDDGLDPVNVIFTGYANASWVARNLRGWNNSPCSEPKTVDNRTYDVNMETPDTRSQAPPCWGPRYHIRIWDMGRDPVLGHWSIGAVHHEHTECRFAIFFCHHVIDSWEQAEALVRSTFTNSPVMISMTSLRMNNTGYYQGIYNDGNASVIQVSPINLYSVTFQESGLPAHTQWSVIMNGTTSSSKDGNITVRSQKANYAFQINKVPGYVADVSAGSFNLTANRVVPVRFTSTQMLDRLAAIRGVELFLVVTGVAWSIVVGAAIFEKRRKTTVS